MSNSLADKFWGHGDGHKGYATPAWCPFCNGEIRVEILDYTAAGRPIVRLEHECVYVGGNVVEQGSGNAIPGEAT